MVGNDQVGPILDRSINRGMSGIQAEKHSICWGGRIADLQPDAVIVERI